MASDLTFWKWSYMLAQIGNVCIRCGKQRIVVKTWTEHIGVSLIKYSETVCPDPECQKFVDKANTEREEKGKLLASQRAQSKQARINLTLSKRPH